MDNIIDHHLQRIIVERFDLGMTGWVSLEVVWIVASICKDWCLNIWYSSRNWWKIWLQLSRIRFFYLFPSYIVPLREEFHWHFQEFWQSSQGFRHHQCISLFFLELSHYKKIICFQCKNPLSLCLLFRCKSPSGLDKWLSRVIFTIFP